MQLSVLSNQHSSWWLVIETRQRMAEPGAPTASITKTKLKCYLLCESLGQDLKHYCFLRLRRQNLLLCPTCESLASQGINRLWSQTHLEFKSSLPLITVGALNIGLPFWAQVPLHRIVAALHKLWTHGTWSTGGSKEWTQPTDEGADLQ